MRRNEGLQALRGVAALSILVFHFFFRYGQIYHQQSKSNGLIELLPTVGVFLFCLLTGLFVESKRNKGGRTLFLGRIKKIWPCYFISITTIFLITRFYPLEGRTVGIADYFLNIGFVNGFIGRPYVDGAHWYLTTLIACIFWFSIIIKKIDYKKRSLSYCAWLVIVVLLYVVCQRFGANSKYITFILICLGGEYSTAIICGVFIRRIVDSCKSKGHIIGLFVSVIANSLVFGLPSAIVLIIDGLACVLMLKRNVSVPSVLTFLGDISYHVYVIHQNLGYIIMHSLENHAFPNMIIPVIPFGVSLLLGYVLFSIDKRYLQPFFDKII